MSKKIYMVTSKNCHKCEQLKRKAKNAGREVVEYDVEKLSEQDKEDFSDIYGLNLPWILETEYEARMIEKCIEQNEKRRLENETTCNN